MRAQSSTLVARVSRAPPPALAQRGFGGFGGRWVPFAIQPNAHYDGRFTFVRVKYETAPGGYWWRGLPSWAHGYPLAEQNLMKIMNEVSYPRRATRRHQHAGARRSGAVQVPGRLHHRSELVDADRREAAALRAVLQKGGFLIVDDFKRAGRFRQPRLGAVRGEHEAGAARTCASTTCEPTHPIFHAFFEIDELDIVPQAYNSGKPIFRGVYEDNDPRKRLQMIINYNTDVSQFWEWSGTGLRPIDQTNEAYKLGVNYLVYGLTH